MKKRLFLIRRRLYCVKQWLHRLRRSLRLLAMWPLYQHGPESQRICPTVNQKYAALKQARSLAENLLHELGNHYETLMKDVIGDYPINHDQAERLANIVDRRLEILNDWSRLFKQLDSIEIAIFLEILQNWERENRCPPLSNYLQKHELTQINCDIWLLQSALKTYLARLEQYAVA